MKEERLTDLPNIGKVLSLLLAEVDIHTPRQLMETGSREAFLRLKGKDPKACIDQLYALEGAIRQVRWHDLSDEIKMDLKQFFRLTVV